MSMSEVVDFKPTTLSSCKNHNTGNGRECSYGVDSENYSTNTMDGVVTRVQGNHPAL